MFRAELAADSRGGGVLRAPVQEMARFENYPYVSSSLDITSIRVIRASICKFTIFSSLYEAVCFDSPVFREL